MVGVIESNEEVNNFGIVIHGGAGSFLVLMIRQLTLMKLVLMKPYLLGIKF